MRFSVFLTHGLLMIFLLLVFGMPTGELHAQEDAQNNMMPVTQTFAFDDENHPNQDGTSSETNRLTSAAFKMTQGEWTANHAGEFQDAGLTERAIIEQSFSGGSALQSTGNDGNAIRLYMEGTGNTASAEQSQGNGNIMNLGIYGNSNHGDYLQKGSNNYIFDRIGSEKNTVSGVSHKIHQYGSGLSIHKVGMRRMDMQIIQRGFQTQMIIRGSPL